MKRRLTAVARFLFRNFGWKVFSIAVATLLWVLTVADPELTASVNVPVEFKGIPKNLEISSDVPDQVHLEVQGPSGRISGAAMAGTAVVLDLTSIDKPGERTFTLSQANIELPDGVALRRAIPGQIRIALEPRESRIIPVQVRFAGPPPRGYRIASQQVTPEGVRVTGPASRVQNVQSAQTDPIDLSGAEDSAQFRINVFVDDPQVRLESQPSVNVRIRVERIAQPAR
jgi:YbbR domain-containing protein